MSALNRGMDMGNNDLGSFKFLTGDVNWLDYGGKWYRKVGKRHYHVIEFINWSEMVGEADAKEIGSKYSVQLSSVAFDDHQGDRKSALHSSGLRDGGPARDEINCLVTDGGEAFRHTDPVAALMVLEAFHSYGCKVVLLDVNGSNARKLLTAAKRESRSNG